MNGVLRPNSTTLELTPTAILMWIMPQVQDQSSGLHFLYISVIAYIFCIFRFLSTPWLSPVCTLVPVHQASGVPMEISSSITPPGSARVPENSISSQQTTTTTSSSRCTLAPTRQNTSSCACRPLRRMTLNFGSNRFRAMFTTDHGSVLRPIQTRKFTAAASSSRTSTSEAIHLRYGRGNKVTDNGGFNAKPWVIMGNSLSVRATFEGF